MTSEARRSLQQASAGSESVLSAEAVWEGKISTRGDLRIEGTARGELQTDGSITVAEHGRVDGTVLAHRIILAGAVGGHVLCDERLELLTRCRRKGDIESGTLVVQEGAHLEANHFAMLKAKPAGSVRHLDGPPTTPPLAEGDDHGRLRE